MSQNDVGRIDLRSAIPQVLLHYGCVVYRTRRNGIEECNNEVRMRGPKTSHCVPKQPILNMQPSSDIVICLYPAIGALVMFGVNGWILYHETEIAS